MESALRGFVDTAEIILKCSYEGSNASKVEQILLGNEVVLKELVDGLNLKEWLTISQNLSLPLLRQV